MEVFVTGRAGFIGNNLVAELLRRGSQIAAHDYLSSGKNFIGQNLDIPEFEFIEASLLDIRR